MAAHDPPSFHWRYADLDDKNFEIHGHGLLLLLIVVLFVLFVLILISLYVRWACRRQRRRLAAATAEAHPASGPCRPEVGLDQHTIGSLPVRMFRPEEEAAAATAAVCPICLGVVEAGEKVKALPVCGHEFHPECVDRWLRARSSCPLCRASLLGLTVETQEA